MKFIRRSNLTFLARRHFPRSEFGAIFFLSSVDAPAVRAHGDPAGKDRHPRIITSSRVCCQLSSKICENIAINFFNKSRTFVYELDFISSKSNFKFNAAKIGVYIVLLLKNDIEIMM